MFQWDKSINKIDVEAEKVLHLFRSMREVQLALPGISAQSSSAYLCQYVQGDGVATVAVFHLHKNNLLAFYTSDPLVVPMSKTDSMLDNGLNFVESMGFLLTDQDIHFLDGEDREMLWESLPLKAGLTEQKEDGVSEKKEKPAVDKAMHIEEKVASLKKELPKEEPAIVDESADKSSSAGGPQTEKKPSDTVDETVENVDDLLAAVEAMRAKRPGLRARKTMPSPEEMNRRKQELKESLGRILASQ